MQLCLALTWSIIGTAQDESVKGYVTVEPFETRVEALCKPAAYARTWDLPETLSGKMKDEVLAEVLKLMQTRTQITSPDFNFDFDTVHARFVVLDKDMGYLPDDRASIPLDEAVIGVSMSTLSLNINALKLDWNWFAPGENKTPIQLKVGKDLLGRFLTPTEPTLLWNRSAKNKHTTPSILPIPPVKTIKRGHQPILMKLAIALLAITGVIVLILKTKTPPLVFFLVPLGIVALVGAFRFSKQVPELPNQTNANDLVERLLRNTYHSFDYRDEEDIYQVLENSIEGQLLEEVYLDVIESLELEISGGPRVRIDLVQLRNCEIIARNDDAGTFDLQTEWVAVGNVTHWGHTHQRDNRYKAILRVGAFDDTWKISKMRIQTENRVKQVTRTQM